MRIFLNKKAKRGQIFPMRAGDAKQKINLPWPKRTLLSGAISVCQVELLFLFPLY